MSENNRDELLVQYHDGTLSPELKAVVEARLLTDPEWQEAYERIRITAESVHYYGIRQEVAAAHKRYFETRTPKQRPGGILRTLRIVSAAAAVILFLFISFKGYQFYQLSTDKVYNQLYVGYTVPVTRSGSDTTGSAIRNAFAAKDYKQVLKLGKKKDLNDDEKLLSGIAALEQQDYSTSIKWLQPMAAATTPAREDAQYYLSLAYLKNRDYDLAIEQMETILSQPQHAYYNNIHRSNIRDIQMLKWK